MIVIEMSPGDDDDTEAARPASHNLTGVPATTGAADDPESADGAFYKKWATEEFGAESADALAKVYKEYFAAPSAAAVWSTAIHVCRKRSHLSRTAQ